MSYKHCTLKTTISYLTICFTVFIKNVKIGIEFDTNIKKTRLEICSQKPLDF